MTKSEVWKYIIKQAELVMVEMHIGALYAQNESFLRNGQEVK